MEANTFPFLNGLAHFLPNAKLAEVVEMLASIRTSETGVHQKTLNRLVHFIDQFKAMNFANDSEMEQRLQEVRSELLGRTANPLVCYLGRSPVTSGLICPSKLA